MKKLKNGTITLLLVLAGLMPAIANAGDGIKFQHLTLDQAIAKAKKEKKNVFIDIYATWCGPCKYLTNNIFVDEELGDYMNKNFVCVKLDGEKTDGGSLMSDFDLNSFPTMLFLSPEKELKHKIVGAESAVEIKKQAEIVLDPTKNPLYEDNQRYAKGDRDRIFVRELINKKALAGEFPIEMAEEFFTTHPKLNLSEETELLIFYFAVKDIKNENFASFLSNASACVELNQELSQIIMNNYLTGVVMQSIESNDKSNIALKVNETYEAYSTIYGLESLSKKELLKIMEDVFDDEV